MPAPAPVGRAVVVGGSIAGLLTAAALAHHYAEVIVFDRDRLPPEPVPRGGVPHARHCHLLFESGCSAIESLLPGVLHQRARAGADISGYQRRVLSVDREVLEAWLRQRIAELPTIGLHGRTSVLDLTMAEPGRVAGVVVTDLDHPDRSSQRQAADLVVDASGRASRLMECLERHGCPAPPVDRKRIDGIHVTRRFTLPAGVEPAGRLAEFDSVITDPSGSGRGSMRFARVTERDWLFSLAGYGGIRPPCDLAGFTAYARSLAGVDIKNLIDELEPAGDPLTYREPTLVRRRFERLRDPVEGLIAVGDARCAVDAAGGAGISAAAFQAVVLRDTIGSGRVGLPRRHYRRSARLLDRLWESANDRYPALADQARG